jgi:hypothetical protein
MAWLIQKTEVRTFYVEANRGNRSLRFGKVREHRRKQPLDRAGFCSKPGHSRDVQMCRLGSEQKIGVQKNRGVGSTGAIHSDWNSCVRAFLQISVHSERDGNIVFLGEMNLAHGNRLEWLVG